MRRTVYILHGWAVRDSSGTKKLWGDFLNSLTELGYRPIFLSIPGLSAPLDEVWDLDNYESWLEGILKDKQGVYLLGHSFGGQLAIRYTANHPNQIKKLFLIAPAGLRDKALKARVKRSVFYVAAKIGGVFFKSAKMRNLLYKVARERDYQNAPPLLRRTMSNILDEEVVEDLPQITCSTCLIWGDQDTITPYKHAKIFSKKIPHVRLQVIEGARHSPHYTHVEQITQKMKECDNA